MPTPNLWSSFAAGAGGLTATRPTEQDRVRGARRSERAAGAPLRRRGSHPRHRDPARVSGARARLPGPPASGQMQRLGQTDQILRLNMDDAPASSARRSFSKRRGRAALSGLPLPGLGLQPTVRPGVDRSWRRSAPACSCRAPCGRELVRRGTLGAARAPWPHPSREGSRPERILSRSRLPLPPRGSSADRVGSLPSRS